MATTFQTINNCHFIVVPYIFFFYNIGKYRNKIIQWNPLCQTALQFRLYLNFKYEFKIRDIIVTIPPKILS